MSTIAKDSTVSFIYFTESFSSHSLLLFFNLKKITIRFRYGLYYYFFWLKTGCKNIKWKSSFTVFFLLDFIFSSSVVVNTHKFSITMFNYNILPIKKNNFTVSKGPIVKKKQSRVQYSFKQIFLNVTKVIQFVGNTNSNKHHRLVQLTNNFLTKKYKRVCAFFSLLNYDIFLFLMWVSHVKSLNFNIETNFFFLKKKFIFMQFHDIAFFNIGI